VSTYTPADLTRDVLADLEEKAPRMSEAEHVANLTAKSAAIQKPALSPVEEESKRRLGLLLYAARELSIAVHGGAEGEELLTKARRLNQAMGWYDDASAAMAQAACR
jgi:hypothetical protein